MKRKTILTWATLVLAAALGVACGKKTAPLPPQAVMPAPVAGLVYQLDEKGVTLSWPRPRRTAQGERLPLIDKFLVERAVYKISDFCESCPVHYTEVAAIGGDDPAGRRGQDITYREEGLRPDHLYFYRVKTGMGWRVVSRPSAPVSFRWQLPMAAPAGLRGQAGERRISLSWQPPAGDLDGEPVVEPLHYQLYRRVGSGSFKPLGSPVAALFFTDLEVENGVSYEYKVKAVRVPAGTGVFSNILMLTPRDLTPPPAPQGLSGLETPEGIRIFWQPVTSGDLGGYQILRRSGDSDVGEDFKVIGRVLAPGTSFTDKTLKDQETCSYGVRAFDLATPANESPLSAPIKMKRNK